MITHPWVAQVPCSQRDPLTLQTWKSRLNLISFSNFSRENNWSKHHWLHDHGTQCAKPCLDASGIRMIRCGTTFFRSRFISHFSHSFSQISPITLYPVTCKQQSGFSNGGCKFSKVESFCNQQNHGIIGWNNPPLLNAVVRLPWATELPNISLMMTAPHKNVTFNTNSWVNVGLMDWWHMVHLNQYYEFHQMLQLGSIASDCEANPTQLTPSAGIAGTFRGSYLK